MSASSIAAITKGDGSGATLAINSYDSYGIPGATNIGRFGYTGQIWLAEIGMNYYKARIYSPTLGRFLQTDPIGYEDQYNLYAYVGNDPVNKVDPTGMEQRCTDNRDGTQTCEIVVTGSILQIALLQLAGNVWNTGYLFYRAVPYLKNHVFLSEKPKTVKEGTDEDWEDATEGAERGASGEYEKEGGQEQAEKDFGKLKGIEVESKEARVKILPDGTKAVLRPSSSGRPTIERQSPTGRKPDAGSRRRIRYNP